MKKVFCFILSIVAISFLFGQNPKSKKSSVAEPPFLETRWVVLSLEGKPVSTKNEITPYILFDKGNLYYGNTGCNSFYGKFSVRKKKLKMKYSGATKTLCKNMDTETQFLKVLKQEISHYVIENSVLILMANNKELMRCRLPSDVDHFDKSSDPSIEVTAPSLNQDKIEKEEEKEVQESRE
ncbi:MAG TPA: META domain-containing protein [Bacteroidales bacterium]|jgi:heat shock protein HslJ|nr:META domain-containing protein [Bacteroidales bacterium]